MICLICRQGELVAGVTSVHLERNEMQIVIDHVPARVCTYCGEAYVDERVAEGLLLQAVEISKTGALDGVFEYNTLS